MQVPGALYLDCDVCGDITLHEVVHGKVSGKKLELQVRCRDCGTKRHHVREEVAVSKVPVVVSEGERSHRTTVEIETDDIVLVGDELLVDGIPVQGWGTLPEWPYTINMDLAPTLAEIVDGADPLSVKLRRARRVLRRFAELEVDDLVRVEGGGA